MKMWNEATVWNPRWHPDQLGCPNQIRGFDHSAIGRSIQPEANLLLAKVFLFGNLGFGSDFDIRICDFLTCPVGCGTTHGAGFMARRLARAWPGRRSFAGRSVVQAHTESLEDILQWESRRHRAQRVGKVFRGGNLWL